MQIAIIKKLVESYSKEELLLAEESLINEEQPAIEVEGEDEGEQLTHVMAALWIQDHMHRTGDNLNKSVREYSVKVRTSIS